MAPTVETAPARLTQSHQPVTHASHTGTPRRAGPLLTKNKRMLHIFRANCQPLTSYAIEIGERSPLRLRNHPRKQFECDQCWRKRWAKNLVIQVYYDGVYIWCAERCEPIKYQAKRAIWRKQERERLKQASGSAHAT
jgi:hypothetical protein